MFPIRSQWATFQNTIYLTYIHVSSHKLITFEFHSPIEILLILVHSNQFSTRKGRLPHDLIVVDLLHPEPASSMPLGQMPIIPKRELKHSPFHKRESTLFNRIIAKARTRLYQVSRKNWKLPFPFTAQRVLSFNSTTNTRCSVMFNVSDLVSWGKIKKMHLKLMFHPLYLSAHFDPFQFHHGIEKKNQFPSLTWNWRWYWWSCPLWWDVNQWGRESRGRRGHGRRNWRTMRYGTLGRDASLTWLREDWRY